MGVSESLLLTPGELKELTGGLTQGAAQIRWLRANGIEPFVGVDGKPKVTRAEIAGRHRFPDAPRPGPNFGALDGAR